MLDSSRRAVMLGDHGKIGHVAGARIASVREVAALVTDSGAAPADLQALKAAGLDVLVA
jgi:DeoR family transcriptional regulator, fructose operon transcriptional repressor